MLQCAKDANDPTLLDLNQVFTSMLSALSTAEFYSEIALTLQCFIDSLKIINTSLPPELVKAVLQSVNGILDDLAIQRQNRVAQRQWMDDVQKGEEEEVEVEEKAALHKMQTTLEVLMGMQGGAAGDLENVLERVKQVDACVMKG